MALFYPGLCTFLTLYIGQHISTLLTRVIALYGGSNKMLCTGLTLMLMVSTFLFTNVGCLLGSDAGIDP